MSQSVERTALIGASWLALFRFTSQAFSWVATILIARMLEPADYGLLEMAVIIPMYAMQLGELGLGPAIVQRKSVSQSELSTIFWFSAGVGFALSVSCYLAAPAFVWLFNEPRLLQLTQAVSVLFLLSSLRTVPSSLLSKNLDFKKIGQIEILAVVVSSSSMLGIAMAGGGVWTLIAGLLILSASQLVITYTMHRWLPDRHFKTSELYPFLKFGAQVSFQGTLFYMYTTSGKFFGGRAWSPTTLGQYTMALQLAQLPSEKITVLINHVAYPTFSLLSNDLDRFRNFYLKIVKVCATLVFPLFVGGFLVGAELIVLLLSDKWASIGRLFEYLCLAQISVSLNAVNSFVHNAQGRTSWSSIYTLACALLVPVSFFLAVPYGLEGALVPWFTTYIFIAIVWIAITINKMGVPPFRYLAALWHPFAGTVLMAMGILLFQESHVAQYAGAGRHIELVVKVVLGAAIYGTYLWLFDRGIFNSLALLRRK